MKLLITGINGFLGRHLINYLLARGYAVFSTGRGFIKGNLKSDVHYINFDLTNNELLLQTINEIQPNIIIHIAAMSKPDECELNKEACILNNVDVTKNIADAAKAINAKLIFTSTDFVFGEGENHKEESITKPLNFYGESKLMAETYIQKVLNNYCIIRPVFIYGKQIDGIKGSFVQWVQSNLENDNVIKVVNDQFRTPTYVEDICFGIERLVLLDKTGIYHFSGEEVLTPYQMAFEIAEQLNLDISLIISVDASVFPEPVKRAKKCILNIDKSKQDLNFLPLSFNEGLKQIFS
jgi:dTDP-4-dehydrorhamnose reductase